MRHWPDWRLLRVAGIWVAFLIFSILLGSSSYLSAEVPSPFLSPKTDDSNAGDEADALQSLIDEALTHSPLITAARRHWEADTRMPIQEGSLPDPQITFQNVAVGNPILGNNLQSNNFAYFGYGFSQEIPFPGKLKLRASVADKEAESARAAYQAQQRAVVEQVRETYFNLFYLTRTVDLLRQTFGELRRVEHITEAQYQVGMGQQQDVLKAQLETTALLNEVETTREQIE
jgi:outer membrane protein, heavy metal efflux system